MAQVRLATEESVEEVVASVTTTKTYTTTINFDTANLHTSGAELFDPSVGSTIEDIRFEIVTPFSGGGVTYLDSVVYADEETVYNSGANPTGSAPSGTKVKDLSGVAASREGYLPVIVAAACTLKVVAVVDSGGPATAGQMKVHVLVSEQA